MLPQILLAFGFVFFVLAAIGVSGGRVNLVAAGLACWLAVQLVGAFHK